MNGDSIVRVSIDSLNGESYIYFIIKGKMNNIDNIIFG